MAKQKKMKALLLHKNDNIAVALSAIQKDSEVIVQNNNVEKRVKALETINFGHKFAVANIKKGTDILKYGEVIGIAIEDIPAGAHVHIHNIKSKRGSEVS